MVLALAGATLPSGD